MNWYVDRNRLKLPDGECQKLNLRLQARADQTNKCAFVLEINGK